MKTRKRVRILITDYCGFFLNLEFILIFFFGMDVSARGLLMWEEVGVFGKNLCVYRILFYVSMYVF